MAKSPRKPLSSTFAAVGLKGLEVWSQGSVGQVPLALQRDFIFFHISVFIVIYTYDACCFFFYYISILF